METDPFFVLLTDALRAGPGSAPWQQAINSLRERGLEGTDEHRLLLETRENLESGRDYRAVRAGPGFTRKVMAEIEKGPSGVKSKGIPTATIVAILCGIVIISVVGVVLWKMSSVAPTEQSAVEELARNSQGFVDKIAGAEFTGAIPNGWHAIGALKLDESNGLRPDPAAAEASKNLGGGIVIASPLPEKQEFAVDVTVHSPSATNALLLEAFVTTDANFNADKGTSSHDLVWQVRDKGQLVLINGSEKNNGNAPPAYHAGDGVRLIVGKDVAIIESIPAAPGAKPLQLWAGPHELGTGPRYVGVRFLQTGSAGKPDISVRQIKVSGKE
jgi:hypothetical protein